VAPDALVEAAAGRKRQLDKVAALVDGATPARRRCLAWIPKIGYTLGVCGPFGAGWRTGRDWMGAGIERTRADGLDQGLRDSAVL
jgi:hypothetical protein